jgi:hypothetical protein
MPDPWCAVCNTQHGSAESCPGELVITEPERHGWRVLVHTGARTEVYGVLVGPAARGLWRARVLTYPRMLWSIPGGRGTMKFVGATPQDSERNAVEFILGFCNRRGYTVLGEPAVAQSVRVPSEGTGDSRKIQARQRYLKNLPVRFGRQTLQADGQSADLSHGGLSIVTDRPLPQGAPIKMRVDLEGFSVPLSGRVAWSRMKAETGRPVGMGVQLTQAPPMYRRYVDGLREQEEAEDSAPDRESPR